MQLDGGMRRALAGMTILALLATCLYALSFMVNRAYADDSLSAAGVTLSAQAGHKMEDAKAVTPGNKMTGVLTQETNEDWYKVKLNNSGRFQVKFDGEGGLFGSWKVTLYDANSNEIASTSVFRLNLKEQTILTTGLSAGTYYLRVQDDVNGVFDWAYYITPEFKASKAWEAEFNNSKGTASSVPLATKVNAGLQNQADEDWFAFEVKNDGKFELSFGGDSGTAIRTWGIALYNANEDVIYEGAYTDLTGKDEVVCTTGLGAGTYYLRVSNGVLASGSNYHFKATSTASKVWETEVNNTVAAVDAIPMNKSINGSIQRLTDEDWFAVDIKEPGKLHVAFGGDKVDNGTWTVTLYNKSNSFVTAGTHSSNADSDSMVLDRTVSTGTYYLRVNGLGVTGASYHLFASMDIPISAATVTGLETVTYNGKAHKPVPTVKIASATLKEGTDYTVSYKQNKNAGEASVILTGKGSYTGTAVATFTIKPVSIAKATMGKVSTKTFTNKVKKPKPSVTLKGVKLVKDTDYVLKYSKNKKVGTATVKAVGKGNYKGSVSVTFKIKKGVNKVTAKNVKKTLEASAKTGALSKAKSFKLKASSKWAKAKVTFKKANAKGGKKIVVSKAGKVTCKKGLATGTYKVKVKVKSKASANYKSASKTITATIKVS